MINFMDDLLCMSENKTSAQYGNNVVEETTGKKYLQINFEKTSYVVVGKQLVRRKLRAEIEKYHSP